eukprot:Pompholyxophrys_punicea_v1_NODE_866_length_1195_cov_2.878070.p2 type:complete len:103 gc:universal NODE_866_length_1195_cov_2.878070:1058-750(-)
MDKFFNILTSNPITSAVRAGSLKKCRDVGPEFEFPPVPPTTSTATSNFPERFWTCFDALQYSQHWRLFRMPRFSNSTLKHKSTNVMCALYFVREISICFFNN